MGAIFTQDCFTRPLQKLLPTETVAVLPTFLRCDIVMMMMMMMVTAYKAIIITITTVITVAVMTSCEKFTERGRGNCTDVRIDSLNDWRINRCPRVVWTKEILFKISIKSTLVKCFPSFICDCRISTHQFLIAEAHARYSEALKVF